MAGYLGLAADAGHPASAGAGLHDCRARHESEYILLARGRGGTQSAAHQNHQERGMDCSEHRCQNYRSWAENTAFILVPTFGMKCPIFCV